MLSILVLYSPDRFYQFTTNLMLLRQLDGFYDCQAILISDGPTDLRPFGFDVVEVERDGPMYRLGRALEMGIERSHFDKLIYIDCDRVLSIRLLRTLEAELTDGKFLYPRRLFNLRFYLDAPKLASVRDRPDFYKGLWYEEDLGSTPHSVPRRGPFSGCVAFTKSTHIQVGSFDNRYVGSGYSDVDYYMSALRANVEITPLDDIQLHLKHSYLFDHAQFMIVNCYNGVKYHDKWDTPITDELLEMIDKFGLSADRLRNRSLSEVLNDYSMR